MSDPSGYTPQPGDTVRWSKEPGSITYKVERRGWQDSNNGWHYDEPHALGEWVKVPDLPPILERWTLVSAAGAHASRSYLSFADAQQIAQAAGVAGILHVMPSGTCEMLGVDDE